MSQTGLVFHDHYLAHDPGFAVIGTPPQPYPSNEPVPAFEHPRRVARVKELIDGSGLIDQLIDVPPRPAEAEDVGLFHTRDYIKRVLEISVLLGVGDAGQGARMTRGSYEIALLAAGGAMASVDAVLNGQVRKCYALGRPPGHHAVADMGMGFCIFNNVAVAALHALQRDGAERILIVDWDVHHGNGTQQAFYGNKQVLFISLHQEGLYPENSGLVAQVGEGAGEGFTVNLPLPAGTGDAGYLQAFERVVVPIAKQFAPDLLLVSSGLDASRMDPLGRMMVTAEGFRRMTRSMKEVADDFSGGRMVVMHEGGYSQSYAPFCGLAIVEEMAGVRTSMSDRSGQERADRFRPSYEVGLDTERALREIIEFQNRYWRLQAPSVSR
ncbi:MAG: class II histone deacetylase [Dehalococcoidia bacterium]